MDASAEGKWRGERRVRLLEAAARVFSRSSYEAASMDEIAHEAGMGKPTLYRYFSSKDDLFAAVFVEALDTLEARLAAVLKAHAGVEERLTGLVAAIAPTVRDHLVSLRFLSGDAAAIDVSKRRIFRERRARIARFLVMAIEQGIAKGEVRWSVDASRTAHMIIGMIWSATAALESDDDETARDVAALILHGIAPDKVGVASPETRPGKGHPISNDTRRADHPRSREATTA